MGHQPTGVGGMSRRGFLKRSVGTAAALGAGPMLLSGCGSRGGPRTLKFWNFYGPQNVTDPTASKQSKWFVDLVDRWNAQNATKVELIYVPNPVYLGGAKLPTAFAANEGPDIFLLSAGDFMRYYNGGVLTDLTPYMTREAIDDFFPAMMATRTVNGKIYALPMEIEPLAMFYNVDAWEKAHLSEGDIPTTWDQMLNVGAKLNTPQRKGLVFEVEPGYYQNFTWYPWLWQGGGEVVDAAGQSVFDSPAARQALGLWRGAIAEGIAPRTAPAADQVVPAFTSDLVGMWQSGIWNVVTFRESAPKYRYGVFKLPVPTGGRYTTDLGGWAFAANAKGTDPEAAAKFIVWALGSMQQESIQNMVDWCIGAKSDLMPRRSALKIGTDMGAYDSPILKQFKDEIFPGGRAEPHMPPVVYEAVSNAIQACQLGQASPASQASLAGRDIQAYMSTYRGAAVLT